MAPLVAPQNAQNSILEPVWSLFTTLSPLFCRTSGSASVRVWLRLCYMTVTRPFPDNFGGYTHSSTGNSGIWLAEGGAEGERQHADAVF